MIKTFNLLILALVAKAQNEFKVTVTQQGEGDFPTKGSKITAHYTGTLLDGTVFDSSVTRGKPFNFVLGEGRVIKCWDEGFAQLNKGSKAVLNCPPDMAYGDRGAGALIKAGATLQFEVELLDFTIPAATPKKLAFRVEKLNEGTGPTVPKGVNASVHYTGTLLDGTVFDSSVPRGQPFTFKVGAGQVISCWDQGILQMQKGQKAIFNCPSEMAYGSSGAGGVIGPNADLKFEVEVLDFDGSSSDL